MWHIWNYKYKYLNFYPPIFFPFLFLGERLVFMYVFIYLLLKYSIHTYMSSINCNVKNMSILLNCFWYKFFFVRLLLLYPTLYYSFKKYISEKIIIICIKKYFIKKNRLRGRHVMYHVCQVTWPGMISELPCSVKEQDKTTVLC